MTHLPINKPETLGCFEKECAKPKGRKQIFKIYIVKNGEPEKDVLKCVNLKLNWENRFLCYYKNSTILNVNEDYTIIETDLEPHGFPYYFFSWFIYNYDVITTESTGKNENFTVLVKKPLKGQPHQILTLREWSIIAIYKSKNELNLVSKIPKQVFSRETVNHIANYGYPIYNLKHTIFRHFWNNSCSSIENLET